MAYIQEENRYRVCSEEAIVSGDRELSQPARRNSLPTIRTHEFINLIDQIE